MRETINFFENDYEWINDGYQDNLLYYRQMDALGIPMTNMVLLLYTSRLKYAQECKNHVQFAVESLNLHRNTICVDENWILRRRVMLFD